MRLVPVEPRDVCCWCGIREDEASSTRIADTMSPYSSSLVAEYWSVEDEDVRRCESVAELSRLLCAQSSKVQLASSADVREAVVKIVGNKVWSEDSSIGEVMLSRDSAEESSEPEPILICRSLNGFGYCDNVLLKRIVRTNTLCTVMTVVSVVAIPTVLAAVMWRNGVHAVAVAMLTFIMSAMMAGLTSVLWSRKRHPVWSAVDVDDMCKNINALVKRYRLRKRSAVDT